MSNVSENSNFFEKIKEVLNFQECIKKFDLTTCKTIEIISYFGFGFFLGFLLKRYFKIIFLLLICLFIALFFLDNLNIIKIDWLKIRQMTGFNPSDTVGTILNNRFQWIKDNLVLVLSTFIGFLIGNKIG